MSQTVALPRLAGGVTVSEVGADNLRALRMDRPIEQRRLMLLVGRNGIGKSSYARLFPLLRQSVGPTREPLLWWKEYEVDFGDFSRALRRGASEMTFSFEFTDSDGTRWEARSSLCTAPQGSRVGRVELRQGDASLRLEFDDMDNLRSVSGYFAGTAFEEQLTNGRRSLPPFTAEPWRLFGIPNGPESPDRLLEITEHMFHGNTELERRQRIVLALPWQTDEGVIVSLQSRHLGAKFKGEVARLGKSPERLLAIRRARFCWWALERLRQAELLVEEMARRSVYLGPFRAAPERGYRSSGSAVEQIDSSGRNLALFLVALSPAERDSLNDYLMRSLGFRVHTRPNGTNWELQVELADDAMYELLDVGFGYSQVLPVAVQLWASGQVLSTSRTKASVTTIVIEQPELHLHPHQQVLIARALGACAALDDGPVQIVETHSDHLIGEVGMLIARGELPAERVSVLCMEPHPDGGTRVRTASFDADGMLQNWPSGFMSP